MIKQCDKFNDLNFGLVGICKTQFAQLISSLDKPEASEPNKKPVFLFAVLNVVNEYAVYKFLNNEIRFTDIPKMIEQACEHHDWIDHPDFETLIDLEAWSIEFVNSFQS